MESGDRDMYRQFQDWCLRTYGDSGKTKTVTRKKYERIVQLLNGSEGSSTDNAKFKFWVKSKGFQLGAPDQVGGGGGAAAAAAGGGGKQVLYVPVKTTVSRQIARRLPQPRRGMEKSERRRRRQKPHRCHLRPTPPPSKLAHAVGSFSPLPFQIAPPHPVFHLPGTFPPPPT